jgi:hypothetical protein
MLRVIKQKIIQYCDEAVIEYATRAKMSASPRVQIEGVKEADWLPLLDRKGNIVSGQETYRASHCIGEYEKAITLIIQRKAKQGQTTLHIGSQGNTGGMNLGGYIYRVIATHRDNKNDSEIVRWYNQRAEDSENGIMGLFAREFSA